MQRVLLDTDTLSEILKGRHPMVVRRAFEYADYHGRFTYSAVSVLEILYGLHFKDATKQMQRAQATFGESDVIVPTLEDYVLAGITRGRARRQGKQLTTDDCLIGATASRLGIPIVTGNFEHFEAMRQTGLPLLLEDWRKE